MKRACFLISVFLLTAGLTYSQKSLTLYPTKDATLLYTTNPSANYYQTTNYGTYTLMRTMEWTSSGYPLKIKALIDFDLSDLPENVHIVSANLYLNGTGGHRTNITEGSSSYKSNASKLSRVLTPWSETGITWNKAEVDDSITITTTNQVTLANSTTRDQDYVADVTNLVRDMLKYPSQSYGLYHELVTESAYTEMRFATSDYATSTDHPKLELVYYKQDTYQIGEGTSVSTLDDEPYISPFGTYYEDSKHQYIFTAEELYAAGMSPGYIHSISFDIVSAAIAMSNFKVSIGHTNLDAFSTSAFVSGLTNVVSTTMYPTTGWNELVFEQNTFSWDGESNIIIETCFDNNDYDDNSRVRYSSILQRRTTSTSEDGSQNCSFTISDNRNYGRPNIKFSAIDYDIEYAAPQAVSNYSKSLTSSQNYTQIVTAKEEGYLSSLLSENDPYKISEAIAYTDGLGRSIQTTSIAANPSGKDIIQFAEYDDMGRAPKAYLPYVDTETALGKFRTSPGTYQADFYDGTEDYGMSLSDVDTTSYPFSEFVFDDSPSSQVLEQGAPGGPWQPGSSFDSNGHSDGNTVKSTWESNSSNELKWRCDASGYVYADNSGDDYNTEDLLIKISEDENGNTMKSYYTKEGLLLFSRRFNFGSTYETIYVYDDLNRLRYIVPPECAGKKKLKQYYVEYFYEQEDLELYAYIYKYDKKGRLSEKKLPGVDPIYYIYDNRDRLVLSQDGNLRLNNDWTFIKYDEVNRPVISGIINRSYSRTVMQDTVDLYDGISLFEERYTDGTHEYTNRSYPNISSATVYAVNYYDDYEFIDDFSQDTLFDYHQLGSEYDSSPDYRVYTKPTGGKVKMIGADYWLQSAIYYDKYGRVLSTVRDLYPDGYEITNIKYKFNGQVEQSILMHTPDDSDITLISQRFEYDHQGRVLEQYHQVDNQDEVLLQAFAYNELGQLIEKNIYCPDSTEFLQSIDYEYNIRGWLRTINKGLPMGGDKDLYTQELQYENPGDFNADTLYNGMVSATTWWQANNDTISAYGFQYDDLYQLKEADFHVNNGSWVDSDNYNVNNLNYDKNGNIESVLRQGDGGLIDLLQYEYDGNQPTAVGDLVADESGRGDFYDGTNGYGTTEYFYDKNGNMTSDANKGIDSITYNFLDLPVIIDFGGGDKIKYSYDATGTRWKTVIEDSGSATDSTIYMGGFVYNNDTLSFAQSATGRIVPDGSDYRYDHFITDHLGSTRVVFTDLDDDYDADILQDIHYYPFGMEMAGRSYLAAQENTQLYTGKKIDKQYGLDWYSHGARYYDPQLAVWHTMDPLAERNSSYGPYHYVLNNPVNFIDPNGMTESKPGSIGEDRERRNSRGVYYNWEAMFKMSGMMGSQIFGSASGPSYYEYQVWQSNVEGNALYTEKNQADFLYWWMSGHDDPANFDQAYDFLQNDQDYNVMMITSSGIHKGFIDQSYFKATSNPKLDFSFVSWRGGPDGIHYYDKMGNFLGSLKQGTNWPLSVRYVKDKNLKKFNEAMIYSNANWDGFHSLGFNMAMKYSSPATLKIHTSFDGSNSYWMVVPRDMTFWKSFIGEWAMKSIYRKGLPPGAPDFGTGQIEDSYTDTQNRYIQGVPIIIE